MRFANRIFCVTVLTVILLLQVKAEERGYAVSKIPPTLLKNANAVKRVDIKEYEVISMTKARLYEKYAITILNEAGDKFSSFYKHYDNLRVIKSIDGKLFDAEGKDIKSVKNKDIKDYSAVSSISLMEDSRVKVHDFYNKNYPYTVEYEVVTEFNNTYILPAWFPQSSEYIALERAELIIKAPLFFSVRYKMVNYPEASPKVSEEKGIKTLRWTVTDLLALINEYAAPDFQWRTTCVFLSPEKFEIAGFSGSMAGWKEMGLFQWALNQGRDKLPESVKQQIQSLTSSIHDEKSKVKVLYEYLQKNTRYISIQLGIGGLQPFDAEYVAKNSYGDCKALSNYMYSLLKEAGIKSHYTLIRSGRGEYFFTPDFTQDPFNHIILCVPFAKDTIWLECTSQTLPAGYLGSHTDNRYALLVTEEGGKLVRTPKYGLRENLEVRNVNAVLEPDATLKLIANTKYMSLLQDSYHGLIHHQSKDKVKEVLQEQLDFATYDITNFDYKENKEALPIIEEKLCITAKNYATVTGKRLFIVPNVMNRSNRKLPPDAERKNEIEISVEYKEVDSIEIKIPPGYIPESVPQPVKLESKFGKYSSSVLLAGDKITYYRHYEHYSGRFPAADYTDLVKFYETIYKADRARVVLVKEETTKGF